MSMDTIPLEEKAIMEAEEFCANFVRKSNIPEHTKEDRLEPQILDSAEPQLDQLVFNDTIEQKEGKNVVPLPSYIFVLLGLMMVTVLTLWYSCT